MPVVGALCTNTRELVDPHDLEKSPGNRRFNSQASIPRVRGKWSNSCPTVLLSSPKHCFGRGPPPPRKTPPGITSTPKTKYNNLKSGVFGPKLRQKKASPD